MFKISVQVDTKTITPAAHARIMKQVFFEAAVRYRERTFPKHFENVPETRPGGAYGYKARSEKYQRRKQRSQGHRKPFVYQGRFERDVLASTRITATRNKFVMRGYFSARGLRGSKQAQFSRELSALSPQEIQAIIDWMKKRYLELAQRPENKRKRQVR